MPNATNATLAVVQRMYDCFDRDDLNTIRTEIFDKDLVWRLPGHHPLAGTKRGAEETLAFFAQLRKAGVLVDLIKLDSWGDDTVVETHRGHGQFRGASLDTINCTHYRIRSGKIFDVQVFLSDQYAADAFFNIAFDLKPIPDRLA
jgi:ketosteroid isomerase-like protein